MLSNFFGIIIITIVVIFLCFAYNTDFWQGYRNSKFIDDVYKGKYDINEDDDEKETNDVIRR